MTRQEILSTVRRPEAIALIALPGIPMAVGAVALVVGLGFDNPILTRLGLGLLGAGATPEAVVVWNIFDPEKPRPTPQGKPAVKP